MPRLHPLAEAALPSLRRRVSELLAEAAYSGQHGLLVAGTAITDKYDSGSDIDLFVVHEANWRQRWCSRTPEHRADITLLCASEVRASYRSHQNPGVLDAFASGLVLVDFDRSLFMLKLEAARAYAAGSPSMPTGTIALWRYRLSTALDSIDRSQDIGRWNSLRLADLTRQALEVHLRARRIWKPNVKNLLDVARMQGHPAVKRALHANFSPVERSDVVPLVRAVLFCLGGPLASWSTGREKVKT